MTEHQRFRIQFLGAASIRTQNVIEERTIHAEDLQKAASEAHKLAWPLWARSYRLLDPNGRELACVFKLDP
jgi:hypothetical protein